MTDKTEVEETPHMSESSSRNEEVTSLDQNTAAQQCKEPPNGQIDNERNNINVREQSEEIHQLMQKCGHLEARLDLVSSEKGMEQC